MDLQSQPQPQVTPSSPQPVTPSVPVLPGTPPIPPIPPIAPVVSGGSAVPPIGTPVDSTAPISHMRRNVLFALLGVSLVLCFAVQYKNLIPAPVQEIQVATTTPVISAEDQCINTFMQNGIVTGCLTQLPWIVTSSSTKGALTMTVAYALYGKDDSAGLQRYALFNSGSIQHVSYEKKEAFYGSFKEELPTLFDFMGENFYLRNGDTSWTASRITFYSFIGASSSPEYVLVYKGEKELLFNKTSSTTIDFYGVSPQGFIKKGTYTLPKTMESAGYGLGRLCTGDPCGNDNHIFASFDGSTLIINTHRYADIAYICPLARMIIEGGTLDTHDNSPEQKEHPCVSKTSFPEGESIDPSISKEVIKSIKANSDGKTKTVIVRSFLQGGTVSTTVK